MRHQRVLACSITRIPSVRAPYPDSPKAYSVCEEAACLAGGEFVFNGEQHSAVIVHQGGYLTFNDSGKDEELDCLNATTFEDWDVIVALCTAKVLTLVRASIYFAFSIVRRRPD